MDSPLIQKNHKYTYGDYLNWSDEERLEIIDGVVYNMTPAPSRIHQKVLGVLFNQFFNYLDDKGCEVYSTPFDVRLPDNEEDDDDIKTVVQPDLVVVCDKSKLDDKGCKGSPDLIVEVVSPSTVRQDVKIKFALYERTGVKEYWIVYPTDKVVLVYHLNENGRYAAPEVYSEEDVIKSSTFNDLIIKGKEVFKD